MIMIFNRKELVFTYSMKEQGETRMLLSQNKIPYKIVTKNRGDLHSFRGGSRTYTGTLGMDSDLLYEYRIYVHKDDFEKAKAVINHRVN